MIDELIRGNRSTRRFFQLEDVSTDTLRGLVDVGRLAASGGNLQPLKYIISNDRENNADIFECLKWAGYLKDWDGPEEGERPAAYIVILRDNEISKNAAHDEGIAVASIMLAAVEKALAGCIFGSIARDKLRQVFNLPDRYHISLVLALGKGKEKVTLEDVAADGDIKYYRDDRQIHHVPKRKLDEVILSLNQP